jgi:hypothetical protein
MSRDPGAEPRVPSPGVQHYALAADTFSNRGARAVGEARGKS